MTVRSCSVRSRGVHTRAVRALAACGIALCCLLTAPISSAPRADPIGETAADVLSNPAYQTKLPVGALPEATDQNDVDVEPAERHSLSLPEWLFEVARILLFCVLGVAVLGAALYLHRMIEDRNRAEKDEDPRQAQRSDAAIPAEVADPTLREADALAAQGRFAEAVHLLLGAALAYLKQRIAPGLAESLTSREVIDVVDINDNRRSALLSIVGTVEVSHFGGHPVDSGGYDHCRSCFAILTGNTAAPA